MCPRVHILHAEPHPSAGVALIALRQVDGRVVAGHAGEIIAAPLGIRESEHIDVVTNTARQISDPQYRIRAFKSGALHVGIVIEVSSASMGMRYSFGPRIDASSAAEKVYFAKIERMKSVFLRVYSSTSAQSAATPRFKLPYAARSPGF